MPWTTGNDQIIAAPADVKIAESGSTPATVGALAEGGAKLSIKPQKAEIRLESGSKLERLIGYDVEIGFQLANLSPENLSMVEGLENKLCDFEVEQTVPFGTSNTGRTAEVSGCYLYLETDTTIAGKEFAGLALKISKSGASLSDVIALTNLTT